MYCNLYTNIEHVISAKLLTVAIQYNPRIKYPSAVHVCNVTYVDLSIVACGNEQEGGYSDQCRERLESDGGGALLMSIVLGVVESWLHPFE